MIPEEVKLLKDSGYIVLELIPGRWRARGEIGFLDFWPAVKRYKWCKEARPYEDADALLRFVKDRVSIAWPQMPKEQKYAVEIWRTHLERLIHTYNLGSIRT